MSGATVSSNKKLADGTLISIGGVGAEDFLNNLSILVGDDGVADIQAEIKRAFTPTGAGAPAPRSTVTEQQGEANVRAAFPNSTDVELCPTHKEPTKVVQKKDGTGSFTKCVVNDTIISNWGKPGLKDYCPKPKG